MVELYYRHERRWIEAPQSRLDEVEGSLLTQQNVCSKVKSMRLGYTIKVVPIFDILDSHSQ